MRLATHTSSSSSPASSPTLREIPAKMQAVVYRGQNDVRLETVAVPKIGPGELLVRVHTCGICGTDLKKIATGSHSAPRIFGHETGGQVVAAGEGVKEFKAGDRVVVFHHIPCGRCYYCRHQVFAQCEIYKKVGATAGFDPSGGGFSEYVRVMDWIVRTGGVVRIPDGVSYEQACFIEPVNTCWKGIDSMALQAGDTVLVMGQGPIGIILAMLAKRSGARVITSDLFPQRLTIAQSFGLTCNIDASGVDTVARIRELTEGRGADAVILAVGSNALIGPAMDSARPGGKVDEKTLMGSYSASVDLQETAARFVLSREMNLEALYSHRFPLSGAIEALKLAAHPQPATMKIAIQPGSTWEGIAE